eukprot:SAG31_NODE_248_length_19104_cov_3.721019_5_plen_42_part_00
MYAFATLSDAKFAEKLGTFCHIVADASPADKRLCALRGARR